MFFTPTNVGGEYFLSDIEPYKFANAEVIVFCDIEAAQVPYSYAKSLLIFSSPDPSRYKSKFKTQYKYTYTLPTWSEEELCMINPNIDEWYDRFEKWGGVPRSVLWHGNGDNPEQTIDKIIRDNGHIVTKNFFEQGLGEIDTLTNYTLIHIYPQRSEDGKYIYQGPLYVCTFATDYIFRMLELEFRKIYIWGMQCFGSIQEVTLRLLSMDMLVLVICLRKSAYGFFRLRSVPLIVSLLQIT